MTSFRQLNIDHRATPRPNRPHLHVCCTPVVLLRVFKAIFWFCSSLIYSTCRFSDLSSWGFQTFSQAASSLPHHSLNMTRVWWLSQQLRVMTEISPLYDLILNSVFSLPCPFFSPSPLLGAFICTQQHNSSYFSVMTHDKCFVSVHQRRRGSRCLCVTMGKMCVANRDKLFTAFAGLAEARMISLQYVMCVYKTVTQKSSWNIHTVTAAYSFWILQNLSESRRLGSMLERTDVLYV